MTRSHVTSVLADVFEKHRADTLLIDASTGQEFSYEQLLWISLKASELISAKGLGRGDRVAVLLANTPEYAAIFLGLLLRGITVVPINPVLKNNEVEFILDKSGAKGIVYSLCTRPLLLDAGASSKVRHIPFLTNHEHEFHPEVSDWPMLTNTQDGPVDLEECLASVDEEAISTLSFTSGTTSTPKAVVHTVSSLLGNAIVFNQHMGFNSTNRFYNIWPMSYSSGYLNNLLCALVAGGSVVMARVFDAQTALNFWSPVIAHGANTLWLSPAMMATLNRVDRSSAGVEYCAKVKPTVCVGMAPLQTLVKDGFESKYGVAVLESYGLSELFLVSSNVPNGAQAPGAAGRVLPGITIEILDEAGQPLPPGEEGEIVIHSPWRMKGYLDYQRSEPDASVVEKGFATGDIGRLDEEGNLYITGRRKDLIIRGGLNISPRTIEDVLIAHTAIEDVAVVGIPHEFSGEEIVAFLKLCPGASLDDQRGSILELCKKQLNHVAVPNRFLSVDTLPRSKAGKILKRVLREQLLRAQP